MKRLGALVTGKKSKRSNYSDPKKLYDNITSLITVGDTSALEIVLTEATSKEIQRANRCRRYSPLHLACEKGKDLCVALLLDAQADVNQMTKILVDETSAIYSNHQTPLHLACKRGHLNVVKVLIEHPGIKENVIDYHNRTPMDITKKYKRTEVALFIRIHKQMKMKSPTLLLTGLGLKYNDPLFLRKDYCFQAYVTKLDLSRNLLLEIPIIICSLCNLNELNLSYNGIRDIPEQITNLTKLITMNISDNNLEIAPFVLSKLPNLSNISCINNPLSYVPIEVRENDEKLAEFIKNGIPDSICSNRIKLIFVGPEKSGKSHLLKNLSADTSITLSSILALTETKETENLEFSRICEFSLPNQAKLFAWDTGSKDLLYRTHQFFLTGKAIYIIVLRAYEITASSIETWLQQIKTASQQGKSNIILIATFTDNAQFTPEKLTEVQNCLESIVQQNNIAGCFFISNKTKENISLLKQLLVSLSEKHLLYNTTIPGSWDQLALRCRYYSEKRKVPVVNWEKFVEVAKICDLSPDELLDAIEYLRDSGVISYQVITPAVIPEFIILHPAWATRVMDDTKVFLIENKIENNGVVALDCVTSAWNLSSSTLVDALLSVFVTLEIGYLMRGEPVRYLFPALLLDYPIEKVDILWSSMVDDSIQEYGRVYQFHLPTDEVFGRLIIRLLHIAEINVLCIWFGGLIIRLDDQISLVTFDNTKQVLTIRVRVQKQILAALLRTIVNSVDSLIESVYMGSEKIETLIPCLHCLRYGGYEKAFKFTKKECIRAYTSGSPFIYCHNIISNSRCVRVDILAPDLAFGEIPMITELDLGKQIGEGGFGKVYKGTWEGNTVAIKELLCKDEEAFSSMFEEFSREVYTMSSLTNPNLVQLFGITVNPLRMVMEFVSGGDLYHLLHSDVELSLKLRLRIALDIANGMRYLQNISPPIMHRDLRSPNILIDRLDEDAEVIAKVADFGLALSVAPQASGFLGTWQWHAPEVLDANSLFYDEAADIYSFAIVLWETFSGGHPFESYRQNDLYSNHVGTTEEGEAIRHFRLQNIKQAIIHASLRPTFNDPAHIPVHKDIQKLIKSCWHTEKNKRLRFDQITLQLVELIEKFFPGSYDDKFKEKYVPPKGSPRMSPSSSRISISIGKQRNSTVSSPLRMNEPLDRSSVNETTFKISETPVCIHFANNKVWIGCAIDSLLVYKARERSLLKSFVGHGSTINAIVSVVKKIWVATDKGSLFVYDAQAMKNIKHINFAHKGFPICSLMTLHQENISSVWSCGNNRIYVWNAETFEKLYSFRVSVPLNCFYIHFKHMWIGTNDDIQVYKIDYKNSSLRPLCVLNGHNGSVNGFEHPREDELWSCSDDGLICVWSLSERKFLAKINVNTGSIKCLLRINENVWSGGLNNAITWFSSEEKTPQHELQTSAAVVGMTKVGPTTWTASIDKNISIFSHKKLQKV